MSLHYDLLHTNNNLNNMNNLIDLNNPTLNSYEKNYGCHEHNNNITTQRQTQTQTNVENKLRKKLEKINVSKAKQIDVVVDSLPLPKDKERNKFNEYYYQHREEKLEYQKNYNRQKSDAIKDYNKSYYMKRREEILEKARTKVTCECGCVVQLFNMNSHKKTKKHVRYLEMRHVMVAAVARD
jgi:hypothetical protein